MALRDERTFLCAVLGLVLVGSYAGARAVTGLAARDPAVHARRFWALRARGDAQADLVLMGDSRVLRGLDPAQISAATGWRVLNLAYRSGSLDPEMCDEAERHLDPAGRRWILLGVTPNSLTLDAARDQDFHEVHARSRLQIAFDTSWLAGVLEPLRLGPIFLRLLRDPQRLPRYEYHDDGFVATHVGHLDETSALAQYRARFARIQVSPELVTQLLARVSAWRRRGVHVVALRLPVGAQMRRLEDDRSGFVEEDFRARFTAAGGEWIEVGGSYRTYDGSHLTSGEARRFSTWLGNRLAALAANGGPGSRQ